MGKIAGVYQIKNTITGDRYIGSSVNIKRRFVKHRNELNYNKHYNIHLQRSWDKYGADNFEFEILLICDRCNTIYYEQVYLDLYKPTYNKAKVAGASLLGKTFTKEHREKLSKALKGRVITKRARRLISEANKGKPAWNKGCKTPQSARDKISKAKMGMKLSEETKLKISQSISGENHPLYGKHHTKEAREKISRNHADVSGKNNPNYGGHPHSEETKRKISEGLKKHYANKNK